MIFGKNITSLFVVFSAVWLGSACAMRVEETQESNIKQTSEALVSGETRQLWPNHTVPVCFDDSVDPVPADMRREVRDLVLNRIARHANINVTGWEDCDKNDTKSVRISYKDSVGPGSATTGYSAGGNRYIHYGNRARNGSVTDILHEFMHTLGFDHEFDRKENTTSSNPDCVDGDWDLGKEKTYGTPYDHGSMLNGTYCNVWPDQLTPWDIVGLQRAYGRKLGIVGQDSFCIDIQNGTDGAPTKATKLQAYDCRGNYNQFWSYDIATKSIYAAAYTGEGKYSYMDVKYGNSDDGTPLWNWTYNGSNAQKWYFKNIELVGMGGLCLDVPNNNRFSGQTVQLWKCNGTEAQKWTLEYNSLPAITIRSASTAFCLRADSSGSLTLQACNTDSSTQAFHMYRGQIYQDSGQCFDVARGQPAEGTKVNMYQCWPLPGDYRVDAQIWYIRGPIVGLAEKCVDVDISEQIGNGTKVQLWGCHGGDNQKWDFHF